VIINHGNTNIICIFGFLTVVGMAQSAPLADQSNPQIFATNTLAAAETDSPDSRFGLFDGLDHRSFYNEGDYPEPFLVDDTGLEINEARLDWFHKQATDFKSDIVRAEYEKGFGQATVELEVPYERDVNAGAVTQGFGSISVGVRCPFYEYVSHTGYFDTALGGAFELGVPTSSAIGVNPEFVPKIFNDTKVGDHFTVQSILGYSTFGGGGYQGGLQTFEYGFVFGWTIQHCELALPGIQQIVPIFELHGETQLNKDNPGQDILLGDVGLRFNLKTIGRVQPRPGVACIFPIDHGGQIDTHWGIVTSLVFEF
jgi:hypothetical protein